MTSVLKDVTTGTWNYMSPECIRSGGSNFQGHKVSWLNCCLIKIQSLPDKLTYQRLRDNEKLGILRL